MNKPKEVFLTMDQAKAVCKRHNVQYRTDGDKLEILSYNYCITTWIQCPNSYAELLELVT